MPVSAMGFITNSKLGCIREGGEVSGRLIGEGGEISEKGELVVLPKRECPRKCIGIWISMKSHS